MKSIRIATESRSRLRGGDVRSKSARLARNGYFSSEGFSALEALIVMVIILVVIGTVFLSRGSTAGLKSSATGGLGVAVGTEFIAASFSDVQSATEFTTVATPTGPARCGTSSQLLGLLWRSSPSTNTIVSYAIIPNGVEDSAGASIEHDLVRYECTSADGALPEATKTTVLSYNVPTGVAVRVVGQSCSTTTCSSASTSGAAGWASANGLTSVDLVVREDHATAAAVRNFPTWTKGTRLLLRYRALRNSAT